MKTLFNQSFALFITIVFSTAITHASVTQSPPDTKAIIPIIMYLLDSSDSNSVQPPIKDTIAPLVTLTGEADISLDLGTEYIELGATANDATDGFVSVVIGGAVDTNNPGTYTMTYTATDAAGNISEVRRVVNVFVVIDVLALYSPEVKAVNGGTTNAMLTRLDHLYAVADKVTKDSKINLRYNLVHAEEYDWNESSFYEDTGALLDVLTDTADIATLRDTYKADEVIGYMGLGVNCGTGWLNGKYEDYAYAAVSDDGCADQTTAHEIGHNLGLRHSHIQDDPKIGFHSYSFGHGIVDEFVTIMAYKAAFKKNITPKQALYFSNPTLESECFGFPCGIDIGLTGEAYSAETIRQTMKTVAGFR